MHPQTQILLSRLLTRSGDQAWDFALPVTLVMLFPSQFSLVATIFLLTKIGQFIFLPTVSTLVDTWKRSHTAYLGTLLQLLSVLSAAGCLYAVSLQKDALSLGQLNPSALLLIAGVIVSSIVSNVASGLMDIAVGNDWIPTLVPPERLATVNSRLKQIDLFTEVVSPILAGLLLTLSSQAHPLLGFMCVVVWNALSFAPEVILLRRVFRSAESLQTLATKSHSQRSGIIQQTLAGWRDFSTHSAAPAMIAYALLWLSALSPHGVLLTSFLKGGWQLSEVALGFFRGLGAVFGLLATLVYPVVIRRLGVVRGARAFICMQALALVAALPFFYSRTADGAVFLGLILISRIGLYGFSLGEMEIRQRSISLGQRGHINGVASSLTSFATLLLFGAGACVTSHTEFVWMVVMSVGAVCTAAVVYQRWVNVSHKRINDTF